MPALVDRGRRRAQQFFDRIETQLTTCQFLAGDAFSVADITLLTIIDFATWVDLDAAAERPALAAWQHNMSARPSVGA
jgi:glutathione S-transferase